MPPCQARLACEADQFQQHVPAALRAQVCEKEMKTKAFSKMGLGQATKLDPKEKARNEMRDWINETVSQLGAEVRVWSCRRADVLLSPERASRPFQLAPPCQWQPHVPRRCHAWPLQVAAYRAHALAWAGGCVLRAAVLVLAHPYRRQ